MHPATGEGSSYVYKTAYKHSWCFKFHNLIRENRTSQHCCVRVGERVAKKFGESEIETDQWTKRSNILISETTFGCFKCNSQQDTAEDSRASIQIIEAGWYLYYTTHRDTCGSSIVRRTEMRIKDEWSERCFCCELKRYLS